MTTQHSFYFAYGSNMDTGQMTSRCPSAVALGAGSLAAFRFQINSRGVATIVADSRSEVYGVLWRVDNTDLRALDRYEGVGQGFYRRIELQVRSVDGLVPGWVYIAADSSVGSARPGYLERIVAAAQSAGLPSNYIKSITRSS